MSDDTASWQEIDKYVKMTRNGEPFSMVEFEEFYSNKEEDLAKEVIKTLKNEDSDEFSCDFPFLHTGDENVFRNFDVEDTYSKLRERYSYGSLAAYLYSHMNSVIKKNGGNVEAIEKDSKPKEKKKSKDVTLSSKTLVKNRIKEFDYLIPETDDNYVWPDWTEECFALFESDKCINVHLVGPTGAGKSSFIEQICAQAEAKNGVKGVPMICVSMDEKTEPSQLLGQYTLVDGNTVWEDGPVTKCYREGIVLLIDEIDATPPEFLFALYSILDGKPLILKDHGGEKVERHKNFRAACTSNTKGRGDMTGLYAGTNVLNAAFLNRISATYEVNYPPQYIYQELLEKYGLEEIVAEKIARLASEINKSFMEGKLAVSVSLRQVVKLAEIIEVLGDSNEKCIRRAIELSILSRMEEHEANAVKELIRRFES